MRYERRGTVKDTYDGKNFCRVQWEIPSRRHSLSGRVLQLFLILLYYHDSGISREELLDMMYGSGEYANPAGSLRALVFRLRRIMEECLPAGEHIQTEGGVYRWVSKSVSVYVDARDFQATAEKGLEKENEEELLRACGLYQGEFLAQLAGEKWVTIVSVRCQELSFPLPAQPQPSDAGKQRVPVPFEYCQ